MMFCSTSPASMGGLYTSRTTPMYDSWTVMHGVPLGISMFILSDGRAEGPAFGCTSPGL